jgi:3-oxoadipate CoA-transferase beta subunit
MTLSVAARSRREIAARVAQDLDDGLVVNLGIGMPTLIAGLLPEGREVLFHSENGVLGIGPEPAESDVDRDLINASKDPITVVPGASYFSHADSFAMIRGGHVDVAVMGAFQVSCRGDLANWSTGDDRIPAVGGAMDLAVGAKRVVAMTTHLTSRGEPKLVQRCTFPLTAPGCVTRVYTDLAVLDIAGGAFVARELVEGLTLRALQEITGARVVAP